MKNKNILFRATVSSIVAINLLFAYSPQAAQAATDDYTYYERYVAYLDYLKKEKYQKYKTYKEYKKKYAFSSSKERFSAKSCYEKYKLYKKDKNKYKKYSSCEDKYNKYKKYKDYYLPYKKYADYDKYAKYDDKKYDVGKKYGTTENKKGYERYLAAQKKSTTDYGEADLVAGPLGPAISVGLWNYTKKDLKEDYFKLTANKSYVIKDSAGKKIATLAADKTTKVKYDSDGKFKVYNSIDETLLADDIYFEAADGKNDEMIFDMNKPGSSYDRYRGKINLHLYDSSEADQDRIWVINTLPLEHYVWGMGETEGKGDINHTRVMTTSFRTYGYWKIKFSTKYLPQGFKVDATSGNQIYRGYDWEVSDSAHANIKKAATSTQGRIVMYKKEIAITPYSSWTDGRTRSFEDRWGSDDYPWCQSVKDPHGKHPSMTTKQLEDAGNHMVGLSANGSADLAKNHDWDWDDILKYYFSGISIKKVY